MYKNYWTKKINNKKELTKKEQDIIKLYKEKQKRIKRNKNEKSWEPDL